MLAHLAQSLDFTITLLIGTLKIAITGQCSSYFLVMASQEESLSVALLQPLNKTGEWKQKV